MVVHRIIARVFDDAFAHLKGKVQSGMVGVTLFKCFYDAESVQVVVERFAVLAHLDIERLFAGMPKGWMAHVMYERERFYEIRIQVEYFGDGPQDLRDLNGVCQPIAK